MKEEIEVDPSKILPNAEQLKILLISTYGLYQSAKDFVECPQSYEDQKDFVHSLVSWVFANKGMVEYILALKVYDDNKNNATK